MLTGLALIGLGMLIALFPQIVVAMVSGFFMMLGLGVCIASWRLRRLRRQSGSPLVNWITRF